MIRAAIFDKPGQPFRFESFPRPKLASGEALVRISLCTICGSDLHTFAGRRSGPSPCVLGHEPVGVIQEMEGDLLDHSGQKLQMGDRVVWSVAVSCRQCFFCARGLPQKCVTLRKYGHEQYTTGRGPVGGLATHCHLLAGTAYVKVPSGIPDCVAAPAGCATATVAAALRVSLRNSPLAELSTNSSSVVVFGLGMLGLTMCASLSVRGFKVIACDVSENRLEQAKQFGANLISKPADLLELVRQSTAGCGADFAFELSGAPAAAKLSLEVLRIGGTAVWVGAVHPTDAVSLLPEEIVRRCLTVSGIHNYTPGDLASAIAFLAENHSRFPFAELVPHTFPLHAATQAFNFAEKDRPIRVAIQCD